MDDHKQITDAELQKLLQEIDVPTPDENAKISALNVAESQFAQNRKKNEKNRQGNAGGSRLMNVIATTFVTLTGGKNMKKSYIFAGGIAVGAIAVSLLTNTALYDSLKVQSTFDKASNNLMMAEPQKPAQPLDRIAPPPPPAAPTPVPPPPAPPAPVAREADMSNMLSPLTHEKAEPKKRETAVSGRHMAAQDAVLGAGAAGVAAYHTPMIMPIPPEAMPQYESRDKFEPIKENPVKSVQTDPVSTFSIDVDTSSYAVVRRALNNGQIPSKDAVRTEELINYFDYDYPLPESREEPFKPTVALYQTPWNADTMLMHVGIKGHDLPANAEKPRSNLVFLLDVSGSMNSADKLPLLQQAFRMLVDTLQPDDTIAIVTYAGNAGVVLEPTKASDKHTILNAIDTLRAGGGTAGVQGIQTAYQLAEAHFDKEGVNRVILATDGDFNVGITDQEQLKKFIEDKRKTGVYLSVLGFGQGNYNDALMQALAQNGNGNAAYIDSINEARKVLVYEASSTLYPIANDVKIQVEFNPALVAEYRLIGYENRLLNREDFNNDKIDAGDIGAGHTVTAIYELTPVGSKAKLMDDLRYGSAHIAAEPAQASNEYAFLKLRYKLPGETASKLITRPITSGDKRNLGELSDDMRFAAAVAGFGQLLRHDTYIGNFTYDDILELATPARGADPFNYRGEFLNLVRNAKVARNPNH